MMVLAMNLSRDVIDFNLKQSGLNIEEPLKSQLESKISKLLISQAINESGTDQFIAYCEKIKDNPEKQRFLLDESLIATFKENHHPTGKPLPQDTNIITVIKQIIQQQINVELNLPNKDLIDHYRFLSQALMSPPIRYILGFYRITFLSRPDPYKANTHTIKAIKNHKNQLENEIQFEILRQLKLDIIPRQYLSIAKQWVAVIYEKIKLELLRHSENYYFYDRYDLQQIASKVIASFEQVLKTCHEIIDQDNYHLTFTKLNTLKAIADEALQYQSDAPFDHHSESFPQSLRETKEADVFVWISECLNPFISVYQYRCEQVIAKKIVATCIEKYNKNSPCEADTTEILKGLPEWQNYRYSYADDRALALRIKTLIKQDVLYHCQSINSMNEKIKFLRWTIDESKKNPIAKIFYTPSNYSYEFLTSHRPMRTIKSIKTMIQSLENQQSKAEHYRVSNSDTVEIELPGILKNCTGVRG